MCFFLSGASGKRTRAESGAVGVGASLAPYLSQTVVESSRAAAVRAGRAGGAGTHRPGDKDQSEECEECAHRAFHTLPHSHVQRFLIQYVPRFTNPPAVH